MKSFAPKPWVVPQPVLIIGTYNKEGVANAMNAAWAGQWDMKEISLLKILKKQSAVPFSPAAVFMYFIISV